MWISILNWFLAIFSIGIWIGAYVIYEKETIGPWFDNKFGKDDPMPPMPKQQNITLNLNEGKTVKFDQSARTDQPEK